MGPRRHLSPGHRLGGSPIEVGLEGYRGSPFFWPGDEQRLDALEAFLHSHPDVFERHHPPGHLTASALVYAPVPPLEGGRKGGETPVVCLIHHRKLGMWIQLGGHADGERDLAAVALREAEEEAGLTELVFESEAPFDVDVLPVPAFRDVPAHMHYDVRYLLRSPEATPIRPSHAEAHDVAWLTLEEAFARIDGAPTMVRMLEKLQRFLRR